MSVPWYGAKVALQNMRRVTIGELARRAGVGVETVRYYQRRGLFPEPPRQPRGVREYSAEAIELLLFIRRARGLGFSIREVEKLVMLRRGQKDSSELAQLLATKKAELEKQIRSLQSAVEMIDELASSGEGGFSAERWRLVASNGD